MKSKNRAELRRYRNPNPWHTRHWIVVPFVAISETLLPRAFNLPFLSDFWRASSEQGLAYHTPVWFWESWCTICKYTLKHLVQHREPSWACEDDPEVETCQHKRIFSAQKQCVLLDGVGFVKCQSLVVWSFCSISHAIAIQLLSLWWQEEQASNSAVVCSFA